MSASLGFSQEDDQNKRIIRLQIYTQNSFDQQSTSSDAIRIEFTDDGSNEYDNRDVEKMDNLDENLARLLGSSLLTIENREQPFDGEILPLFINQYSTTNYVYKFQIENFEDFNVVLNDNYEDTTFQVEEDSFIYSFSVNPSINASTSFNRFSIQLNQETMSVNSFNNSPDFSISPNPVVSDVIHIKSSSFINEKVNVQIFNQVGKLVFKKTTTFPSNGDLSLNNLNLNSGVYLVKIQSGKHQLTKKMIKH
ncbi:T9SS type A sorting domain-containing protein [Psychroflexus planctonicus]|uniref:Secretion system C-terminal sorting domain-containing protein n=1 Tax=Psychroflexus planctonicus TaxID=1526575 RepID=A0ABQ1SNK9_9FLAO|nr:T9SS type A sorting domain-containing protein [Psychroflexus planctonicus]GGE44248.1 hypothetical protein GCM10010832_25340 [Psychroflexus planctonicus]